MKYISLAFLILIGLFDTANAANGVGLPTITFGFDNVDDPSQVSSALQVLFLLTILSVAPAILLMTTCFTRIVIVFE